MKEIGVDIVDNSRFANFIQNTKFISRILSKDEIRVYDAFNSDKRKLEYLTGRFASKEAIFKCIPKQDGTTNFNEISILNDENGKPHVVFPRIKDSFKISISHTDDYTVAYVIMY